MSGWIPTPADGWPVTLERLQRLAEPLTESEAITDLRWHVDQAVPLPGRRELLKRWGWSERQVKALLADPSRWWDPTKGAVPRSRADLEARVSVVKRMAVPDASRIRPGSVPVASRSETVEPAQSDENDPGSVPDASRIRPGRVHARVPQLTDPPSPSPERESGAPVEPAGSVAPGEGAKAERPALAEVVPLPTPARPAAEEEPTVVDAVPAWARGHRGHAAIDVVGMVVRCLEAVRERTVDPSRCATDARPLLSLWHAAGMPPEAEFAEEFGLVARWARESSDPLAENDIRGIRADGARWNPDRCRAVATLCRHDRWSDRLDAARRWASGAGPPGAYVRGDHPAAKAEAPTLKLTKEQRERWWE